MSSGSSSSGASPPNNAGNGNDALINTQTIRRGLTYTSLSEKRLAFLAKLPFFLNSSLNRQKVVQVALEHISEELQAEFAALYLLDSNDGHLRYWALRSAGRARMEGVTDFSKSPGVKLVVENCFPLVHDGDPSCPGGALDPTFAVQLRNMFCTPLLVRGSTCLGAIQIVNTAMTQGFSPSDVSFVEQFSHQVALAIDNARLFQEAEEKEEQLRQLDRKKSESISVLSHEFRTPLNIIHNASELLVSRNLTEHNKAEMVRLLRSSVERLTRLVAQIRNVSLVQDHNLKIQTVSFDVADFCRRSLEKFEEVAQKRHLALLARGTETSTLAFGEPAMLTVVMQNLLSNAIRFTPDGGRVEVWLQEQEGSVRISVSDTGIGIAKSEINLIFEKFYEVKDAQFHSSGEFEFQSGGLGLGLAAVRHILQAHNSKIEVSSELGKGSTFSFSLPRA